MEGEWKGVVEKRVRLNLMVRMVLWDPEQQCTEGLGRNPISGKTKTQSYGGDGREEKGCSGGENSR